MKKKPTARSGQQATLHDSLFKTIFKDPKYIKELLRVIFPPETLDHAKLDDITIQDGELLAQGGRQLRADLIASLPLKVDEGDVDVTLSLIFEHKSYRDPDTPIQLMEYQVESCRGQRQQWDQRKDGRRNITVSMVLLCCKDKHYYPPSDYLQWVFGDQDVPAAVKR